MISDENFQKATSEESDFDESHSDGSHEDSVSTKLSLPRSRWLLLLVPFFAIAVAGSKSPWALGLFSLLVGICFLFSPPRMRISPVVLLPLALVLLSCLFTFRPVSSASYPEWRQAAVKEFGIILPSTGSPQPWVSLESWTLLAVGTLWLVYCLGHGFGTRERRWLINGFVIGIAAVSVAAMIVKVKGITVPMWRAVWGVAYYGPFPNRNNFSSLLAVGGVLAFAATYDAYRNKKASWILLALALVPMFAAILLNTSRAGVILFFMGIGLWMLTAAFHKRSAQRVGVFASLLILLASGFILFGQGIMGRFAWNSSDTLPSGLNSRANIFFDTMHLVGQSPMLGVGLGNFDAIFPLTQSVGSTESRNYHPESDWTWFLAECGVLTSLIGILALVNILRRTGPWLGSDASGKRDRRLRNAARLGVILIALHGVVDTPSHAVGIWATAAVLTGLALRPNRQSPWHSSWVPWMHRAAAVFCFLAGINWLSISLLGKSLPGDSLGRARYAQSGELASSGDYAGAIEKVTEALAMKPLQHHYYFWRAKCLLELGSPPQVALADFTRTRFLEPHYGQLCFAELQFWLSHNQPLYGIPALRETIRRDHTRSLLYFGDTLHHMGRYPELREPLRLLATEPKQKLLYLGFALDKKDFEEVLLSLLDLSPSLDVLDKKDRRRLFRLWYDRGDRARLVSILEKNPDWRQDGWFVLSEHRASSGDFRGAYQLAAEMLEPHFVATPSRGGDITQLRRSFLFNPTDIARGLDLYEALKARDATLDEAELTLEKIARLPGAPAKISYEQAAVLARKGDYAKAWARMKSYIELLPQDGSQY